MIPDGLSVTLTFSDSGAENSRLDVTGWNGSCRSHLTERVRILIEVDDADSQKDYCKNSLYLHVAQAAAIGGRPYATPSGTQ